MIPVYHSDTPVSFKNKKTRASGRQLVSSCYQNRYQDDTGTGIKVIYPSYPYYPSSLMEVEIYGG